MCILPDLLIPEIVSLAPSTRRNFAPATWVQACYAADVCVFPNSQFSLLTLRLRSRGWTPRIPDTNKRAKKVVIRGLRIYLQAMEFKWGLSVSKWSDVKCSDVEWTDVIYVKWFSFEVKWNEPKWVTVRFLGTKLPCILGWPYTEE